MNDNKLIAEFMGGGEFRTNRQGVEFVEFIPLGEWKVDDLPYHTEWNWLMPVVQKIETLGYWFNRTNGDVTIVDNDGDIVVNTPNSDGGIDMYHKAVVEFINTQQWTNKLEG